jgi:sporulation protein YabP
MAYEEKNLTVRRPHGVILEGRARLTVSGVEDVESFDDMEIVMQTSAGDLIVRGEGLHIDKLSLDTGELAVTGHITDLCYTEPSVSSGSLWTRLFK